MSPMILTILRRERRIRQAREFRRACILSLFITLTAVTALGIAQSLDLIHLHELRLIAQSVTP